MWTREILCNRAITPLTILGLVYLGGLVLLHSWVLVGCFVPVVAGMCCNLVAIRLNGGLMPVMQKTYTESQSPLHKVFETGDRGSWLCDRFPVGNHVYSIGDFLLNIGVILNGLMVVWGIMHVIH